MLVDVPELDNEEGAPELASKQHRTWIAELLRNSWTSTVAYDMASFDEETQGDGVEGLTVAKQNLTKDKLALENFHYDISKFTAHVRTYIHQIIGAGLQPTKQHFILVYSALKDTDEAEFNLIIIQLLKEWRSGTVEGSRLTMLQLLAKVESEYKRLVQLGQLTTKNKSSELLRLQAKFDVLQTQFQSLVTEHK
jgi:DUF438 domain-containing protein